MSNTRIYTVAPKGTAAIPLEAVRLVRATNVAQALRHVSKDTLDAEVATQDTLVSLVSAGLKVEDAGADVPPAQLSLVEVAA